MVALVLHAAERNANSKVVPTGSAAHGVLLRLQGGNQILVRGGDFRLRRAGYQSSQGTLLALQCS